MLVYKITNLVNGKNYVGQTREHLKRRWTKHVCSALKGSNTTLHKAIRKYGRESFSLEILCVCLSEEQMKFAEIAFIQALKSEVPNGYNLTFGGEGGEPTLETREKMRRSHLGKKDSEETKHKKSVANKGRKKTKEHAENISKGKLGKGFSTEHIENLRISHLGTKQTEETKRKKSVSMKLSWQRKKSELR
jgi:group I intron endonuclease